MDRLIDTLSKGVLNISGIGFNKDTKERDKELKKFKKAVKEYNKCGVKKSLEPFLLQDFDLDEVDSKLLKENPEILEKDRIRLFRNIPILKSNESEQYTFFEPAYWFIVININNRNKNEIIECISHEKSHPLSILCKKSLDIAKIKKQLTKCGKTKNLKIYTKISRVKSSNYTNKTDDDLLLEGLIQSYIVRRILKKPINKSTSYLFETSIISCIEKILNEEITEELLFINNNDAKVRQKFDEKYDKNGQWDNLRDLLELRAIYNQEIEKNKTLKAPKKPLMLKLRPWSKESINKWEMYKSRVEELNRDLIINTKRKLVKNAIEIIQIFEPYSNILKEELEIMNSHYMY